MGRKKNPGFYLYPDDILSSDDCRALSEAAAGVYLFLLCRLSKPPTPGCYQISRYDSNRNSQRSLTQRCLATRDKQARLTYFAEILAENDLPWVKKKVLRGLKELYHNHIIIVEGDMLIQPRMARDNGFELPDIDHDGDPEEWQRVLREDAERAASGDDADIYNKGTDNGTGKGTRKGTVISRAGATRVARNRVGDRDNNINNGIDNSEDSIGGVGESETSPSDKNEMRAPKQGEPDPTGFWPFWLMYDKKRIGAAWVLIGKVYQAWCQLSDDERWAAMDFLPRYVAATPTKRWRMHPQRYIEQRAWLTIQFEGNRVLYQPDDPDVDAAKAAVAAKNDEKAPDDGFVRFWDEYDKKVDRPKSMALWAKLSQADRAAIMDYIPPYKQAQPDKRYRKNPTTFLRNRSWEDEIIEANAIVGGQHRKQPNGLNQGVKVTEAKSDEYNEEW